jgi:F-type H+-transporting ATPase subunit b
MPQLDFSNPLIIAQIVWLLIIFGVLYYIMSVYALPRVEQVLEDRRKRIEGDLAAAQAAKAEAQARAEVLNQRLNQQIAEAEARIGQARDAAMGALRQVSTETAEALVRRLTGRADRSAVDAAVDRALAARGQG